MSEEPHIRREGWALAVKTAKTAADLRTLSARAYADLERARKREAPAGVEIAREALALIARRSDEIRGSA